MLLHADPSLAEVPGFRKEQLDALARSVELRRQQLEDDINEASVQVLNLVVTNRQKVNMGGLPAAA